MATEMNEIVAMIEADLAKERKSNRMFTMVGGGLAVFIGAYLIWLTTAVNRFLEPEELALAAAGAAVDAAPAVSAQLRATLVDGAPDLARSASSLLVGTIPTYRAVLEEEMKPTIDEVCAILAGAAVDRMVKAGGGSDDLALQAAADEVIARLDKVLAEALDAPSEMDGPTPRDAITASLGHLRTVDEGLRRIAAGGGDPTEKELVLAWLNVLGQFTADREVAERSEYKSKTWAPTPPPEKSPSNAP